MSYKAVVTKIFTRPIEGSDNIVLGACKGYQVIVSKDTEEGQLGLFFEAGGQLSEGFATANDLVRRKDENGNPCGGYFEENRRVKHVKMRGARSEGFWCPLSFLEYTGYKDIDSLKEGDELDTLNGHSICNKYFTPETLRSMANKKSSQRKDNPMFRKHIDTDPFKRNVQNIPTGSVIVITEKVHGTSFRFGRVLDSKPIVYKGLKKLLSKIFNWSTTETSWEYLNGTRNTILGSEKDINGGFYGSNGFRHKAVRGLSLHKGEIIYGELVGYTDNGALIMSPQDTTKLKDKNLEKQFGKTMRYTYSTEPNETDLYVYRITMTNEDGQVVELPWKDVVRRCKELALKTVPHIQTFIYDGDKEKLEKVVSDFTDGVNRTFLPSSIDSTHIQEGVVVRYESEYGTNWLKSKSFVFGTLEGYLKESDSFVDTEEIS